jgi:hypothetical protein
MTKSDMLYDASKLPCKQHQIHLAQAYLHLKNYL